MASTTSGWSFPPQSAPDTPEDSFRERHSTADAQAHNEGSTWDTPRSAPSQPAPEPTQEAPDPSNDTPPQGHYETRNCRICFDDVPPTFKTTMESVPGVLRPPPEVVWEDENGRLLRPCRCKGSSQYVHEKCLDQWRMNDPTNPRNYYACPTCGYQYRLSRVAWANFLASSAVRFALTISILIVTVFILGFVADPIITMYQDPYRWMPSPFSYSEPAYYEDDEDSGWIEHFLKGFTSLGVLGFLKMILANPLGWLRAPGLGQGGGRGGTTGRDRAANISWIVIAIGVSTFLFAVWKYVGGWSTRILKKATQSVFDVSESDIEPGRYERLTTRFKTFAKQQVRRVFRDAHGQPRRGAYLTVASIPIVLLAYSWVRSLWLGVYRW